MLILFEALCDVFGESTNVIVEHLIRRLKDPSAGRRVLKALHAGKETCIRLPPVEPASPQEVHEVLPEISKVFYDVLFEFGGEAAVSARAKAMAMRFLKEFGKDEALKRAVQMLSAGGHKPKVRAERVGDEVHVYLYVNPEYIEPEFILNRSVRSTLLTALAALIYSEGKPVKRVETKHLENGTFLFRYKLCEERFFTPVTFLSGDDDRHSGLNR